MDERPLGQPPSGGLCVWEREREREGDRRRGENKVLFCRDFEYLVGMPISTLTAEKVAKLMQEHEVKAAHNLALKLFASLPLLLRPSQPFAGQGVARTSEKEALGSVAGGILPCNDFKRGHVIKLHCYQSDLVLRCSISVLSAPNPVQDLQALEVALDERDAANRSTWECGPVHIVGIV